MFEHAKGTLARPEHGYCTDDNARLLVITSREPDTDIAQRLGRLALRFVLEAENSDGRMRNRMDSSGRWTDTPGTDDCWGRALWGLGEAAVNHTNPTIRRWALRGFNIGTRQRSVSPRAMAFAALGAADVLANDRFHGPARALLVDTLDIIAPLPVGAWRWPEPRLTYANAALAEAVIAAAAALDRPADLDRGLEMLAWLLQLETPAGHLSVTGASGRSPGDRTPQFDQQPIEVAALADACWRAHCVTGDAAWSVGITAAAAWFNGANDAGLPMHDPASGGGYDGLHATAVNMNQGAESTLAYISTMQRSRAFAAAA